MPAAITTADFTSYPPQARTLATTHLDLLNQLPPVFAVTLLREISTYDWKFPAERRQLDSQLHLLTTLPATERADHLKDFAAINPSPSLESPHWPRDPAGTLEQLTAWLWSSGQMEAFRTAADRYATWLAQANPTPRPSQRRLTIIVIGRNTPPTDYTLFRKLRPHGLTLTRINPANGLDLLLAAASRRAGASPATKDAATSSTTPAPYAHWYIDGGQPASTPSLTQISYASLESPRAALLAKIQQAIDSGSMGPEALRSLIAQMPPEEIGLGGPASDPILDHFKMSLLTEGSGTQIFSTTFVQWAARECLRRAQPSTLVLRYAPRQQMQPMNIMLSGAPSSAPDLEGSLIDADMGAYYTWINLNRLPGADEMSFLAWWEGQPHALAIGPAIPQGTTSDSPMDMHQLLTLLT